jgi:hypothetical protein
MKTKQRANIPQSIRLLLTDEGIEYFVRNKKPFSKFVLSDDAEEQGVTLSGVPAPTLQKLVLLGYVHKIEVGVHNLVEQRQPLMDLHKLVTFASLYQQFSVLTSESLLQTAAVRQWNRRHPRYAVGPGKVLPDQIVSRAVAEREGELAAFKEAILVSLTKEINRNVDTDPEDKVRSKQIAQRLLDSLDMFTNFLILLQTRSLEAAHVATQLQDQVHVFLPRSLVPDYSALLLLELLSRSLRDQRERYPDSPEDASAHVIWTVRKRRNAPGDRARLNVILCERTSSYLAMRRAVNTRAEEAVTRKSLNDFYEQSVRAESEPDLGLYYLSFLADMCRRVGILFDPYVQPVASGSGTLINLAFTF